MFDVRWPQAQAYADLLATEGELRGLIGPRELPRLWQRHLLNCAVITDLIAHGSRVADIGSGAGLPGLVVAIRRPDLDVTLIEPMARRTDFLGEAVDRLGLENVRVLRGRAEEVPATEAEFDVVTSRAVAPLDRLSRWSLPLVRAGGSMLAMKGSSAEEEVAEHAKAMRRAGAVEVEVSRVGMDVVEVPVTVVRARKLDGPNSGGNGRAADGRR